MDENSNNIRVSRGIKLAWVIGLVGSVMWALFSFLQIWNQDYRILIFDPVLIVYTIIWAPKYANMWPQESFSNILYYCISEESILNYRVISNLLIIGGIIFGYIKKNRVCAIILLILPFLNFLFATTIGGLSSIAGTSGMDGALFGIILLGDFLITIFLLIGTIGVFYYRSAIKRNKCL
jgi:hypothetical protein